MPDQRYGIVLDGNGEGLVGAFDDSTKAAEKYEKQLDKTAAAGQSTAQQSKAYVDALRQQTTAANDTEKSHGLLASTMGGIPPVLRPLISAGGAWGLALAAIGSAAIGVAMNHEKLERQLNRTEVAFTAQGRAGELSRTQLGYLQHDLALMPGVSSDAANAVVQAYARMRDIGGAQLSGLAGITADYATATGRDAPAAAQRLAAAFSDPAKGARELERELGFLNASQLLMIERFSEAGEAGKAQDVMFQALRDRVQGLNEQALTPFQRKLEEIKKIWAEMFPSKPLDFQAMEGEVAPMSYVYGQRGFEGDARDLQLGQGAAARAAAEERAKAMMGRYDREGTKRRQLTGDISSMQGYLSSGDVDPQVAVQLASDIAAAKKQLDDLNGTTHLTAQETAQLLKRVEELDQEWSKQVYIVGANGEQVAIAGKDYDALTKAIEEGDMAYARSSEQLFRHTQSLEDDNRRLREHVESIGKTKEQLEQLRATREGDALAMAEQALAMDQVRDKDDAYNQSLRERVRLLKEQRELQGQAVTQQAAADAVRAADDERKKIERTLERAIVTSIRSGAKSGADIIAGELKAAFATVILRPLIKPILDPLSGMLRGYLSSAAGSAGAMFGGSAAAASAAPMTAEEAFLAGSAPAAGATAGGFSLAAMAPPVAAAAALYYAKQSGLADRARANPILGPMMKLADPFNFLKGPGGPKNPQLGVLQNSTGGFYLSQMDLGDENFASQLVQLSQTLNDRTKYDPSMLRGLTGYMGSSPGTSPEQMLAMVMQRISGAALPDMDTVLGQQKSLQQQAAGLRSQLPGMLGIDSLTSFRNSLDVSGLSNGPLDQLGAAKSQYEEVLAKARTGDVGAIGQLQGVASNYLNIGRSTYASGADFQGIYNDVYKAIGDVLSKQQDTMADILKDLPATIQQSSIDQIDAIKQQTTDIVKALKDVQKTIDKLNAIKDS